MKDKLTKNKKVPERVSVFVSDKKDEETIDANEVDMKITKLNSMIKNVERRIDAHERRLSIMHDSLASREATEYMHSTSSKISAGR